MGWGREARLGIFLTSERQMKENLDERLLNITEAIVQQRPELTEVMPGLQLSLRCCMFLLLTLLFKGLFHLTVIKTLLLKFKLHCCSVCLWWSSCSQQAVYWVFCYVSLCLYCKCGWSITCTMNSSHVYIFNTRLNKLLSVSVFSIFSLHPLWVIIRPVCVLFPAETRDGSGRHLHHVRTTEPRHPPRPCQRWAVHREGVWCECWLQFGIFLYF